MHIMNNYNAYLLITLYDALYIKALRFSFEVQKNSIYLKYKCFVTL